MPFSPVRLALFGLLAIPLADAFVPQRQGSTPQRPTFRSETDLVQVDVIATDRDGKPVRGLTRADFAVFDRKRPQTIANFEEISHDPLPAAPPVFPLTLRRDVADNQTAQADRVVVVVVDDLHIYKGRTDRTRDLVRQMIETLGSQASMAVIFSSGEHGTQVTDDRGVLMTAIEHITGQKGIRRPTPAVDNPLPGPGTPDLDSMAAMSRAAAGSSTKDFYDNLSVVGVLEGAARMLAADDGRRKAVVLISEGMDKDMAWLASMQSPCVFRGSCFQDNAILAMGEAMRRSNVGLYAIDPRGLVAMKDLAIECAPSPPILTDRSVAQPDPCSTGVTNFSGAVRLAQQGLTSLASVSGGFAVTNSDDLTSGIDRIVSELDHYYMLGFSPADSTGTKYRPIEVTTSRPGVLLRFRHGYQPREPEPDRRAENPVNALAAGVMPRTDLPLKLFALPLPGTGKPARVVAALSVTMHASDLGPAAGHVTDELRYALLVMDQKNNKGVQTISSSAQVSLDVTGGGPSAFTYQIPFQFTLPPGRHQFRGSALSRAAGKGGSVYLEVEVPDFTAGKLSMSGLALGYADGARVPIAQVSRAAASVLPLSPSLDRVFQAADAVRMFCEVSRPRGAAVAVTIQIVDASDRVIRAMPRQIAPGQPGVIVWTLPLRGLPAGAYRLRVSASSDRTQATREVGFLVAATSSAFLPSAPAQTSSSHRRRQHH